MGKLKLKSEVKKEFVDTCKKKNLDFKFIDVLHLDEGGGKIWRFKFKCTKGHIGSQILSNFRKKPGCDKCNGLNLSDEEHIKILNDVHNNFYKYDKFVYKGSKSKITIYCPIHKGYFDQQYESHKEGDRCGICAKNKPKTGKQIIELVKLHSNGFVSTVGINKNKLYRGKDKYYIKCNVHSWHKTQKKPIYKITRGVKCGFCNASRYELDAYQALHQLGIKFDIEQQIKYKNTVHYIDIVLEDKNKKKIFIEIDGEQHSSSKHWGNSRGNGRIELLKIKKRDKQKEKYAKLKKIKLYRISYKDNIREKITSLINEGNFKKVLSINKKFPPNLIKTRERIAMEIHKMYNNNEKYDTIVNKLKVIPSYISNVVTGEKFKELFFYLYPDGDNPNLRRKQTKVIKLTEKEKIFLKKKIKKGMLFADIRKEFSIKFRPFSRGQMDSFAKKNNFKTPYFIVMTKNIENRMKELKSKGLNFNEITAELNKDGLSITRPTVQKKLKSLCT